MTAHLPRVKASTDVEMTCSGDVLQPECEAPPLDKNDVKPGLIPEDGETIRDRSYEQVKRERLKGESEQ